MPFTCPTCFYDELAEPARDYNICDCCGTEFGNNDVELSYAELRANWIDEGGPWFYGHAPLGWNPWAQLLRGNVAELPYYGISEFGGDPDVFTSMICAQQNEECFAMASA